MSLRLAMSRSNSDDDVSIKALLRRIADELYAVVSVVGDCQMAVEDILDRGLTRDDVVRLQALDALSQTIAEVAGVLERLAASEGSAATTAALFSPVKLSDLRRRLLGDPDPPAAEAGELELW